MMRKLIAGNWKMHKTRKEAIDLVNRLKISIKNENVDVVIFPPFTAMSAVSSFLDGSSIMLGAQNMHYEDDGAFTGEISPLMIKDMKCTYVLVGHSERRIKFNESNEIINKKIKSALEHIIKPILCIGESQEERASGRTKEAIEHQLRNCIGDLTKTEMQSVVIAYEPLWAIGTGLNATPQQAEEVHAFIREVLKQLFGEKTADDVLILYGGSVKPANAKELLMQKDINGLLVGSASLDADSFAKIVNNA